MSADGVWIRQISSDEIDIFRRIRLEALRTEPSSFASRFEGWAVLSDDEWRRRLNDPVFIAFSGDEPIGMMGLLRQRPAKMAHRATLVMVYLRESFRRTGLAGDLLSAVVDFAKETDILQLELAVSAENPQAIGFYLREGFSEVGIIPGGLLDGDREIGEILMVRRLVG
ncbi:GNAT family N-acetyltransferase [Rhizobium sp. P28RR-XV]|uniref:GNAT family N-acetyltransferase n=1 Tax=Rhizobium sp. P28RR-XV TaxID=2726737 RepID=UPI00145746D1|nr:GNAT family N-acetyltransferase [Rhizobium sp. P28RR-XV]NLR85449.1 GNAT family N-acetyltransferase [Rhizobium sp. P28RR-XV]